MPATWTALRRGRGELRRALCAARRYVEDVLFFRKLAKYEQDTEDGKPVAIAGSADAAGGGGGGGEAATSPEKPKGIADAKSQVGGAEECNLKGAGGPLALHWLSLPEPTR